RACALKKNAFFFFQAVDGIRDFHVTGVQTCALPISAPTGAQGGGQAQAAPTGMQAGSQALVARQRAASPTASQADRAVRLEIAEDRKSDVEGKSEGSDGLRS